MHTPKLSGPANGRSAPTAKMIAGLSLLQHARDAANDIKLDPWEFAIGLNAFFADGLTETDVRRLVAGGFAEHALERNRLASRHRSFRRVANLALTDQSRFVLTPAGAKLLKASNADAAKRLVPHWDSDRRQLWYADRFVKEFRRRAANQQTILAAFQEDGWPPRIDDPLPMVDGLDPKERLHEAVRRLNYGHVEPILVFRRDGTGEGVSWNELGGVDCKRARLTA